MSGNIPKTEFEKMLERKAAEEESSAATDTPDSLSPEEAPKAPADEQSGVTQVQAAELKAECEQLKDQLLRARAEFDNYRKRTLRDMEQNRLNATGNLIRVLLPVLDNLERALAHANEEDGLAVGVRMVHKQLLDALSAEGLEPVPARGMAFDPTLHDALAMAPSETVEHGIILEEFERGYRLRDQVLRPAKVIVSSGPETDAAGEVGPEKVPLEEETPLTDN